MIVPATLNSALNIQAAIAKVSEDLRAVHDAADSIAPEATPEIWNAIESLRGALRDIAPYAQAEHQAWLDAELKRQKSF